jgi:Leucine-rich repeat (LRR) protein
MKKLYPLLSVLFLIYWGCEELDTTPPTVSISSHSSGQTVNKIITISVTTQDNEGISKVEFYIDDSLFFTDTESPYQYDLNTTTLEDDSYTIFVRSYDTTENTTDSERVVLTIDNSLLIPTPSILHPIIYSDGFQISWSQNNDDDFVSYKLYESLSKDMSNQTLIYETDNRTNTIYFVTNIGYYQIVVENEWGLQSASNIGIGDYNVELWGEYYSVLNTTELNLSNSGLTGEIPPEIGNLVNLWYLNLRINQLTGSIPPEIGNLDSLTWLSLGYNQLTGSIPSEIGNLTNLTHLNLSDNQLTGEIPESICDLNIDWSNSGRFYISNNQLCPLYPSCIEDYVGEQDISNCEGVVQLWGEVYSIEYTTELDLSNSGLTGEIPPEIWNLTNLTTLYLYDNQLTGLIPSEIGNLTNLISLKLYDNQLTGSILPEIGNLTNLTGLDLRDNQLTGSIPSEIGNLTNLTYLYLYDNQLTGSIPSEIGNLTNLTHLDLSDNQLTGSIHPEIGNLTNLTYLYLYSNQLTGDIPSEIGNLTNLFYLNLRSNELTGSIPPEIGNLTNLTWLYLYNNQLTGEIPESICDLNIDWSGPEFNITNNQLCPPYPSCIEDEVGEQDTSGCD